MEGINFNLIFSNPPFYPPPDRSSFQPAVCIQAETDLLATLAAGAAEHLAPDGRALFVTSSFTRNEQIHAMLAAQAAAEAGVYSCRMLRHGQGLSQDLFLWEIKKPC